MCKWILIFLVLCSKVSFSQSNVSFSAIDWSVQSVDAPNVETLAHKLTDPYHTDLEKVRAIFSWIASHISYNVSIYNRRPSVYKYSYDPADTITLSKSPDQMVADRVLRRRIAVCDGYSRLFKILCDYSGIKAEIISGYARCNMDYKVRFRTNHIWNAVMVDNAWHLLDVTWGSGYINYADEYVAHLDEYYFLTPPSQFSQDHYPENPKWLLLDALPFRREFKNAPFKYKTFVKYSITSFHPNNGVIEASVGDTVKIELETRDLERDKRISSDPFFDSTILTGSPSWAFLNPAHVEGNKIYYYFIVDSYQTEWLHILYNDDIILQYKLNIVNKTVRK